MLDGRLVFNGYDKVRMSGVDHGGDGKVLAQNPRHLIVKWPAHKYWSARGQQSYASPCTTVYEVVEWRGKNEVKVKFLIEYENRRGNNAQDKN